MKWLYLSNSYYSQVILDNVYQLDTFLAILLIELLIVWNCFAFEYFHFFCFDVFYFLPTVV